MFDILLLLLIPIIIFWLTICCLMYLYDLTGKRGYAVVGMLPLSIAIFIVELIKYILTRFINDEDDW